MTIRIKCKHCGRGIKAADEWAGREGNCPTCKCVNSFPAAPAELPKWPLPTIEIDEELPAGFYPSPDVEPYYSRSGISILCCLISAVLLLVAIGKAGDYAPTQFEKSENATVAWRLFCASWGFAVLAVLTTISRRLYRVVKPMKPAVILSLVFASHAAATPPAMIPGYVNRRQPTTHVHTEHGPFVQRDAMLTAANARAAQLQSEKKYSPFQPWQILGKPGASDARIVDYANGQVTLQKRNGSTKTFREVRLGKVDRAALETWKQQPAPARVHTFPPITVARPVP